MALTRISISDTELPIMGIRQYEATRAKNKDSHTSPAAVDFILSTRPKIYALLQLLKYRHNDAVELVNEQYKLQNQPLSHIDQVFTRKCRQFINKSTKNILLTRALQCCIRISLRFTAK